MRSHPHRFGAANGAGAAENGAPRPDAVPAAAGRAVRSPLETVIASRNGGRNRELIRRVYRFHRYHRFYSVSEISRSSAAAVAVVSDRARRNGKTGETVMAGVRRASRVGRAEAKR